MRYFILVFILLLGFSCSKVQEQRYDQSCSPPLIPPTFKELIEAGFTFPILTDPESIDMIIGYKQINDFTEIQYELGSNPEDSIGLLIASIMETHIKSEDINLENINEFIIKSGGVFTSELKQSTPNPGCYQFKFKKNGYPLEFEGRFFTPNWVIITYPYYKTGLN